MALDEHFARIEMNAWYHLPPEQKTWIPIDDMKIGWYACDGRNFNLGYWNGKAFEYERTKWNCKFDDREYHWDTGTPYGTVKPIKYLGDSEQ